MFYLLSFVPFVCLTFCYFWLIELYKRKYFLPVTTPYSGSTVDRACVLHDPADHNKAWARISIPIPIS